MSLMVNQLVGFGAGGVVLPTIVFTANAGDGTDVTVYTFSSVAIGAVAATRVIAVAVSAQDSGPGAVAELPSSVTIGGITANIQQSQLGNPGDISIWTAVVPTGTTATIVVTYPSIHLHCGIGVWAMYNLLSATKTDSASSTANPGTTTAVDVLAGGVIIAYQFAGIAHTTTWSGTVGVVENFDANEVGPYGHSGASIALASASTGQSVTATRSASNDPLMVVAAFR